MVDRPNRIHSRLSGGAAPSGTSWKAPGGLADLRAVGAVTVVVAGDGESLQDGA
jgi:hypothetical protein